MVRCFFLLILCFDSNYSNGKMFQIKSLRRLSSYLFLLLGCFACSLTAGAQNSVTDYSEAFITVDDDVVSLAQLREAGLVITARYSGFLVAQFGPDVQVSTIRTLPGVEHISWAMPVETCSDSARYYSRVEDVQLGNGLEMPYTGKDVIIGIIDCGFDFNHVNLMDSTGNTRVKSVYMPLDNGEEGRSPVINRIMLPGKYYETPELIKNLTTDDSTSSHGTQVAGIAAGSYRDNGWYGVAPDADIVVCGIPEHELTDARVAYGITFIDDYARRMNKPCVVNISLGTNVGLHDGSSFLSRIMEQMSGPGRIFVVSAGNDGNNGVCVHRMIENKQDTVYTLLSGYFGSRTRMGKVCAWSKDKKVFNTRLIVVDTQNGDIVYRSRAYSATTAGSEGIISSDEDPQLAEYYTGSAKITGSVDANGIPYSLFDISSLDANEGNYVIGVQYYAPSPTELVAWGSQHVYFSRYGYSWVEGGLAKGSINDIATTDSCISVGSYNSRQYITMLDGTLYHRPFSVPEQISYYSAYGPDENGIQRPDVCAPGSVIISSGNRFHVNPPNLEYWQPSAFVDGVEYPYCPDLGTSMSAPIVTGAIALWLQANPSLSVADVRQVLKRSSYKDKNFTTANKERWGAGKLDANAGLRYVLCLDELTGDVNGDGEVNISDINAVISIILGSSVTADIQRRADVNGDGEVNISDINAVIAIIL